LFIFENVNMNLRKHKLLPKKMRWHNVHSSYTTYVFLEKKEPSKKEKKEKNYGCHSRPHAN
jgi:hypothetical protein